MKKAGYILGAIWSAPISILGLLFVLIYKPQSIHWRNGIVEMVAGTKNGSTRIIGNPGGQTFGIVQWYASEADRNSARLRRHETTHTLQAFFGSVVWALAYGIEFLARLPFYPPVTEGVRVARWRRAYRALWWERQARNREPLIGVWGT